MSLDEINNRLNSVNSELAELTQSSSNWISRHEGMCLSIAILLFAGAIIAGATYLLRAKKRSNDILRLYGTILILVLAVFLVVAGYSSEQIAPVIGLMGTVAGYILGSNGTNHRKSEDE